MLKSAIARASAGKYPPPPPPPSTSFGKRFHHPIEQDRLETHVESIGRVVDDSSLHNEVLQIKAEGLDIVSVHDNPDLRHVLVRTEVHIEEFVTVQAATADVLRKKQKQYE